MTKDIGLTDRQLITRESGFIVNISARCRKKGISHYDAPLEHQYRDDSIGLSVYRNRNIRCHEGRNTSQIQGLYIRPALMGEAAVGILYFHGPATDVMLPSFRNP